MKIMGNAFPKPFFLDSEPKLFENMLFWHNHSGKKIHLFEKLKEVLVNNVTSSSPVDLISIIYQRTDCGVHFIEEYIA